MKTKHLFFALLITSLLSLILAVPAYAVTFRAGQSNITISKDQTIKDDLYASGQSVDIEGTVDGDVLAAAGTVTVDGTISGDLAAAGGTILLNGEVKDDVRIGGGTVYVNGKVGGDILVGGGQVILSSDSEIGEDALFGSGTLKAGGSIRRNLWVGAGSTELNGTVGGNAKINADTINLGSNAEIGGDLTYTSENKAGIDSGAQIEGETTHKLPPKQTRRRAQPLAGVTGVFFYLLFALISFAATLATAFVFIALLPRAAAETSRVLTEQVWPSVGVGFLVLFIVPIAAIIVMITLIGIHIGIIAFGLYFLFIYLSQIVFSIFLGEKILTAMTKKEHASHYLSALIGLLILAVVGIIPILGWLVKFIVMLFGLGALTLASFGMMKRSREPVAAMPVQGEQE
jgi:cytoskeletal protein CcmA (bactofilin family)